MEWYKKDMFKKHNMMRDIKFLTNWIITLISLFTFTITKKDTKSIIRCGFTTLDMTSKNKTRRAKDHQESIIRSMTMKSFERRQP